MKRPFDTKTVITAVAVAFVAAFCGYVSGIRTDAGSVPERSVVQKTEEKESLDVAGYESNVGEKSEQLPIKYILKEKDGKIALLLSDDGESPTIYKSYDINVSALPEADRIKLSEGILAESLSEALMMVEDYLE